ncbi:heavy metal translocating P-type ATPase [Sporanaerobacter sp. PP17-6a]|uniref:heavy metal translocating P-type ATPase n=1 Tax=Sporanaerobacter sp. PP17-6a TaxID=1891289 RepID=UPI0008A07939|nr:heavy metal translocating P-type ATPase [Sporanaerobacter sp. PP17-6a]SCL88990.1 Cadmium, zinc and cobalt-transporting ATPase [Sporanaerobacter sp. PP17-6a]
MIEKEFLLEGLNCTHCAGEIEEDANKIKGVKKANLNFVTKKLKVEIDEIPRAETVSDEVRSIVKRIEPDVIIHEIGGMTTDKIKDDLKAEEEEKNDNMKFVIGVIVFLTAAIFKFEYRIEFILFFISYIIIGGEVLINAFKNILKGKVFDENFLMSIATIGAFIIGEYPEAVSVMLFYEIGEYFQGKAVDHSRKSISTLLDIRPDYANIETNEGIKKVDPNKIEIGQYIIVKPGEKVPLDGIVAEGNSFVDTSNITGESVPRSIQPGDNILSGFVNKEGLLKVRTIKKFGESTVSKILDLVENSSKQKANIEKFITRFSKYYTSVVVFSAIALTFIPPLFFHQDLSTWVYRALIFLVASCPCALVVSIPLGFFGGIGGASKSGILVKGGNYLEGLSMADTIVFDKTGTLTKGIFEVTEVEGAEDYSEDDILKLAAYGEIFSNHPIAKSIVKQYGKEIDKSQISNYREIPGKGIEVTVEESKVLLGNVKLLQEHGLKVADKSSIGTVVYVSRDEEYIGNIVISDEIRDESKETIKELKALGIRKTIMLSGDKKTTAEQVGKEIGIDEIYGELLPQEKVEMMDRILKNKKGKKKVIFVGDGVNDAPVIARADVGISMGGMGSDAAVEASDVVIMDDEISKVKTAMNISHNTNKIVRENVVFALGVKMVVLTLGALGIANMWSAVFADVGVALISVFNSIRALKVEE